MSAERDFTIMQDFIRGRLSDVECREFQQRLVREPALVRELEQSLRMREGLQHLRARGYVHKTPSAAWRLRAWTPAGLSAAAIAALAVFLSLPRTAGPPSVLMDALQTQPSGNTRSSVAAHFTFVPVRGGSVPDLELPTAGLIEIRAAAGAHQIGDRYSVLLVRRDETGPATTVASLTGLAVGSDGYLRCYADAARLTAGRYLLRVQPDSSSAAADSFDFNLVPPPSSRPSTF